MVWAMSIVTGLGALLVLAPTATAQSVDLEVNTSQVVPGQPFVLQVVMSTGSHGGFGGGLFEGYLVAYSPGSPEIFIFVQNGRGGNALNCQPAGAFPVDFPEQWPTGATVAGSTQVTLQCQYNSYPKPGLQLPNGTYDLYAGLLQASGRGDEPFEVFALAGPVRIVVAQ
jgi:hypothetical protein